MKIMKDMEEKDPKDTFEEKKSEDILEDNKAEEVIAEEEVTAEEEKPVELTPAEEIETEWARTLHIDYDAGEARRRAEAVQQPSSITPPPVPGQTPPPAPEPAKPAPFNGNYNQPANNGGQAQQPNAQYGHPEPMPKTYLVWAVVSMVLCCFIPGLIAVIFSTSVSSKYYACDYEGARRASEVTQYWIIASIVLGLVSATLYLPVSLLVN